MANFNSELEWLQEVPSISSSFGYSSFESFSDAKMALYSIHDPLSWLKSELSLS